MTTVALVEANSRMRKMLRELIDSAPGYHCVCACATPQEALREVPKHQPDVALMDLRLPAESGIICTARLTEMLPELEVIMVSVSKDIEVILQALRAGACGYILKRFEPEEILQALAEARAGGAPMTREIARLLVRSFRTRAASASASPDGNGLTTREAEMLMWLAKGLSNKEIAQKTNIAPGTVRNHLEHVFKKLHVRCRTEAAAKYLRIQQRQTRRE